MKNKIDRNILDVFLKRKNDNIKELSEGVEDIRVMVRDFSDFLKEKSKTI